MQRFFVLGLSLALATQCANAIFQKKQVIRQATAVKQGSKPLNPIVVRPNAGKGPDTIKFGLRAMNFYGANLREHTFSLDMVMSVRWTDPRVIALIPDGLKEMSLGLKQAETMMWMPGINVTNRDIEKYEIISASVTIFRSGEVRRVERANTRVMEKFMLENYPFDTQDLKVVIASSKYMTDEVLMEPDQKASGVHEDIWGLYSLKSWRTEAYQSHDGPLEKSRGVLVIEVKRSLDKYSQDHLVPSAIVMIISWAVFYFPFANPFITARLCLSILALLQFTNLIVKSTKELPGEAPYNWNDLFNQQIQILMFVTIVLNLASEIASYTFQNENGAKDLNRDAKFLMPFMSIVNIVLILVGGAHHWMSLEATTTTVKVLLVLNLWAYVVFARWQHNCRIAEAKRELELEKEEEEHGLHTLRDKRIAAEAETAAVAALAAEAMAAGGAADGEDCDC